MAVDWPDELSQCFLLDGYQETPEANIAEFAAEVGPPLRRRRTSINSSLISATMSLTKAEVVTLLDWYRDDLLDGALAFTHLEPRDELQNAEFIFVTPPTVSVLSPDDAWRVTFNLRRMP